MALHWMKRMLPPRLAQAGRRLAVSAPLRVPLFCGLALAAAYLGLELRGWVYPASAAYRFEGDIGNAWRQGSAVLDDARRLQKDTSPLTLRSFLRGYLGRYDAVVAQRPRGNYGLDYPPARLFIMSLWVWHQGGDERTPLADLLKRWAGQPPPAPEARAGPLLTVNTLFGLASAVAMFLLVRHVVGRRDGKHAEWLALTAAVFVWFNPAVILDAHVWPQWDVWVVPFYLLAAYFGVSRRWLAAGMCLGAGAMFKGQILTTAAIFVLWPLFQLRLRAVVEVMVGAMLGAMLIVWPWMLRTLGGWMFFVVVLAATFATVRWIPRGWRTVLACTTLVAAALLAGLCFNGSFGWWHVGLAYGVRHHGALIMGPASNLAAVLAIRGGWSLNDAAFAIDWPGPGAPTVVTMRTLLIAIYIVAVVVCTIGLARQDARGDRRTLVALAAPWVLMYALLPQMHERYLLWGAVISAAGVGVSLGTTLLHLIVTFLACLPIAHSMVRSSQDAPAGLLRFLHATHPDAAWAVILVALLVLYTSITVVKERKQPLPSRQVVHNNGAQA